ncbi:hypothetical protein [Pimelobacter sp. 30-1]|uniref:hypothetical protein n=1 Tax=Pimelobacter sp. 30-1 TaxID=2004991 RepID=UPI001C054DE1|nr:hypothetical protein [Pimelobacter sp. 30-1]MBU2696194.1 hypothetical protein [Pimelobacter sp. 30-1]
MDRPLGRLSRLGRLGRLGRLLPAVLLALPAAPAATAATAPPDDPALSTGSHRTTLPADGPRTFRLERTTPGSTVHVALWYVGAGDSIGAGVRLSLGTAPGDESCGSGAVFRPTTGEPTPLLLTSASTWTDAPEHPCASADTLWVRVGVPSDPADRGRAATLLVYEEPPLSAYAFGLLDEPVTPAWVAPAPAPDPRPLTPGATPADAPVVDDGTYAITVRPGRTALVAVPLDWDQTLRAQTADDTLAVHVLGPLLGASDASTAPGRAQSHVVSFLHREAYDPTAAGASLAGVHYVLVSAPEARQPVTTTLTLARSGTAAEGVPDYASGALVAPQADSRLTDGSLRAPAPPTARPTATVPEDDDGGRTPLLVGGGIAAAVAVALLVRTTRRAGRARGR